MVVPIQTLCTTYFIPRKIVKQFAGRRIKMIDIELINRLMFEVKEKLFSFTVKTKDGFSVKYLRQGYHVINLKDESSNCEAAIYSFGALLNAFSINTPERTLMLWMGFRHRQMP